MRLLQERAWEAVAGIGLLALYAAVLWLLPKGVFPHPDEGGKFIQMESVGWDGGLRTNLRYGAAGRDTDLRFYPTRCGGNRVYPEVAAGELQFQWPVWFPLTTKPLYEHWGVTGLYVIPLLAGWLTALLTATWVRPYSPPLAAVTIVIVGVATPVAYYSFTFLEHTLATCFCMVGLWALCRQSARWLAVACGFVALVAAAVLRIEMSVFAVAAGIGWLVARVRGTASMRASAAAATRPVRPWLYRRETWILGAVLAALIVIPLLLLTPRHWAAVQELPRMIAENRHKRHFLLDSLRYILINARGVGATQVTPGAQFLALAGLFVCFLAPFLPARRWVAALGLVSFTVLIELSFVITLLSHAYSARQGLFTVAPFLAIALYALPYAWQRRDPALLCLAITGVAYLVGALALLFTTRVGFSGDYLIGLSGPARYVLVFYPVWTALSAVALYQYRSPDRSPLFRSVLTLLVIIAVAMAVAYQGRAILALQKDRQVFARWAGALPGGEPVVTTEWWLAATVAPYFVEREMYCVRSLANLDEWVVFAQAHRISEFTFAVRHGPEAPQSPADNAPVVVESERVVEGLQLTRLHIPPS
jgi:hypothetical protein